jgi:hypothetical protein
MREILMKIESDLKDGEEYLKVLKLDGYSKETIADHCELLYQARLINKFVSERSGIGNKLSRFKVGGITNEGYKFLEKIRNEKTWENINKEIDDKKLPKTIETILMITGAVAGAFWREYNK